MNREELTYKFLESNKSSYVLQLPTSYGKTKLALDKTIRWFNEDSKILIVIPRLVLEDNWLDEIRKWGYERIIPNVTFSTYISLHKHCDVQWDVVILDEAHHISERCRLALDVINVKHLIGLSATLKKDHLYYLRQKFKVEVFQASVKDAIEESILPDPTIILIPMTLDNLNVNQIIEKHIKKNTNPATIRTIGYSERWKYKNHKGPLKILCTQQQYYSDISNLVEWYKQKGMHSAIMKNMWLHKAGERLKWLAKQKEEVIKTLLKELRNYRTLVYCPSIEDSTKLGSPCINSKVGIGNLDMFNAKTIKHIAAVGMLDEGANLVDCKIGIFQMINSSDRLVIQRQGRIFRHKKPVLIFPYWKYTREQEIMDEFIKGYNPELVKTIAIDSIHKIKDYL